LEVHLFSQVSQRYATLSVVRSVFRVSLTFVLAALVAAPLAHAAGPTATTAAPTVQTTPQPAPGSAFGPLQPQVGEPATQTQPTVTGTKRAGDTGNGRGTLLFLSLVALVMIAGVGVFIWYEGAKGRTAQAKRRRHRMRAGRPAAPAAAMSAGARRGPPPPPRKRRAQAAKRKKR
jgi:hypothetical protein